MTRRGRRAARQTDTARPREAETDAGLKGGWGRRRDREPQEGPCSEQQTQHVWCEVFSSSHKSTEMTRHKHQHERFAAGLHAGNTAASADTGRGGAP